MFKLKTTRNNLGAIIEARRIFNSRATFLSSPWLCLVWVEWSKTVYTYLIWGLRFRNENYHTPTKSWRDILRDGTQSRTTAGVRRALGPGSRGLSLLLHLAPRLLLLPLPLLRGIPGRIRLLPYNWHALRLSLRLARRLGLLVSK